MGAKRKKYTLGYEDMDVKYRLSKRILENMSDAEKDEMARAIQSEMRSRGVFPMLALSPEGVEHEIKACWKKDVAGSFSGTTLSERSPLGVSLCKHFYHNFYDVKQDHSLNDRFHDDKKLYIAIRWLLKLNRPPSPTNVRSSLSIVRGNSPTIFSPMRAKAIYERWVPEGGVIFDYSIGWGSRMLGALSSSNNYKYVGVDPDTSMFSNATRMLEAIEQTHEGLNFETGRAVLHKEGSEVFEHEANTLDFAFSSPPYYDLEIYSSESTQSTSRFPDYEDWLERFVRPTIRGCFVGLKAGGHLVINVKNYKRINLEGDWCRIALEEGFGQQETCRIATIKRPGGNIQDACGMTAGEPLFVFKKL